MYKINKKQVNMAYRKRSMIGKRKRYTKKRSTSGARVAPGPYNGMYKRLKNSLKYTGEKKYSDQVYPRAELAKGVSILSASLNTLTTGSASHQRIGIETNAIKLHLRGIVQRPCCAGCDTLECPSMVRILVVLDKQSNGQQANYYDVKQNYTTDAGEKPMEDFIAFNNRQNSDRFVILKDKVINIDRKSMGYHVISTNPLVQAFSSYGVQVPFKMSIPLKGIKVKYTHLSDTPSSYASVLKNNILAFAIVPGISSDDGTKTGIYLKLMARFEFTDK